MESFLNPSEVLKQIELKEDMVAADFGSGAGGWVMPLAKILKKGTVYALDILEEPLLVLASRAKSEKLSNVKAVRTDAEVDSKLASDSCDLVLMTNFLFQVKDVETALNEGKRMLKKDGRILVVDWEETSPLGPKEKLLPEKVKNLAREGGFRVEKEFKAGAYHWALLLKNGD